MSVRQNIPCVEISGSVNRRCRDHSAHMSMTCSFLCPAVCACSLEAHMLGDARGAAASNRSAQQKHRADGGRIVMTGCATRSSASGSEAAVQTVIEQFRPDDREVRVLHVDRVIFLRSRARLLQTCSLRFQRAPSDRPYNVRMHLPGLRTYSPPPATESLPRPNSHC
jgi:hypothetical protein